MRFPTTLAPVIGSKSVVVQSADNAHSTSVDMRAWCGSDGNWRMWFGFTQQLSVPQCACHSGYRVSPGNDRKICHGGSMM